MYDIGKILVAGGGNSLSSARTINLNGASPQVATTNSMATGRRQHNLTTLADGTVLATGGNSSGAGLVDLNNGVYTAELWNPATGTWRTLDSMQVTRQYHSTALLLPDGRVLSSGGGICGDCDSQGYLAKNAEVFSPPYLYRNDGSGQLATRPTITSAPGTVSYNAPFSIATPNPGAIGKVALARLGAVTHSVNMEQRYVPLNFTAGGGSITATAPLNSNIAPPGYYMLFLIGTDGVPSVASMVRVESDTTAPAAPSVTDTDPDSPANDNNPEVKGSAEAGSTGPDLLERLAAPARRSRPAAPPASAGRGSRPRCPATRPPTSAPPPPTPPTTPPAAPLRSPTPRTRARPPAPSITDTDPDSPSSDNNPEVKGTADAGSTVRIYATATCTGSPLATGSAASFGGAGITTPVPGEPTTNLRATASDAAGNNSGCSTAFAYTEDSTRPGGPLDHRHRPRLPGQRQQPRGEGHAPTPGSTVRIYTNASCSGAAAATGSADQPSLAPASPSRCRRTRPPAPRHRHRRAPATTRPAPRAFAYVEDSTAPAAPASPTPTRIPRRTTTTPRSRAPLQAGSTRPDLHERRLLGHPARDAAPRRRSFAGRRDHRQRRRRTRPPASAPPPPTPPATTRPARPPFAYTEDSDAPAAPGDHRHRPGLPGNDNNPEVKGNGPRPARRSGSTPTPAAPVPCCGQRQRRSLPARRDHRHRRRRTRPPASAPPPPTRPATTPPAPRRSPTREDSTAPAAPSITDTDPDSPANDNNPEVKGTAECRLDGPDLHRPPAAPARRLATGSAASFAGTGITITVAAEQHHHSSAPPPPTPAGNDSGLLDGRFAYTEDSSAPRPRPASPTPTPTPRPTTTTPRSRARPRPARRSGSTRRPAAPARRSRPAAPPASRGGGNHGPGARRCDHQPPRHRHRRRRQQLRPAPSALAYTEDSTAPATPSITDTDPDSPSNDNNPEVKGTAEAGLDRQDLRHRHLHRLAACDRQRRQFGGAGITTPVPENQTTNLRATASDAAGNNSGCSTALRIHRGLERPRRPPRSPTPTPIPRPTTTTPRSRGTGAEPARPSASTATRTAPAPCSAAAARRTFNGATGITVTVPGDQTTNLRATATDSVGNVPPARACSHTPRTRRRPAAPSITDTDPDSPASTTIPRSRARPRRA